MRSLVIVASLLLAAAASGQSKNILMYGNSFSMGHGGVHQGLARIATATGHATPNVVARFFGGQTLTFHATDPAQVAAITNSLGPNESWDVVVIQGHSIEATATLGDPQLFRSRAVAIATSVRNHSPGAAAVLFQTWARAHGHGYYPGNWPGPLAMHDEVRVSYQAAVADIRAAFGSGSAWLARVGDCVALQEFQPAYYAADLYHQSALTTLLTSMCLFSSIYRERICLLDPDLTAGSPLGVWLASHGLDAADWRAMAAAADRCSEPPLRPFPGSRDHLLLESGRTAGPVDAGAHTPIGAGSNLTLRVSSRNNVFDQAPAWLLASAYLNGAPPSASPTLPELYIDTASMLLLQTASDLQSPLTLSLQVPFSLPGLSVLVQGVAFAPSTATGNPQLTATDGHVLEMW